MSSAPPLPPLRVALAGNPNCGKTALFNLLTGSRQKVANYAGVTVERKEGTFRTPAGRAVRVLDLPGLYSLEPQSPDEQVTADLLCGRLPDEPAPEVVVGVLDSTDLRRHLRLALALRRSGLPLVLALNMTDLARNRGARVDVAGLAALLGVPVVETTAVARHGALELLSQLDRPVAVPVLGPETDEALLAAAHRMLGEAVDVGGVTASDRIDRVVLHPVLGPVLLALTLFLVFQAVFAWAEPLMDGIEAAVAWLGALCSSVLPAGPLRSLLVDGIIAGAGGVLVFLPQILILFAFILVLEDSGYLPRAAFLLDRLMGGVGLSGRAFIPLLSSFACAIPGIMATRTIPDKRDRLVTILVAPLMTCSARLPVYTLLIGAFIPARKVAGLFELQGLVLFILYFAGVGAALAVAWLLKRFGRSAGAQPLLMELPSYHWPQLRSLALGLWQRAVIFVSRVGGILLALSVLLWFLSSFPAPPVGAVGPAIEYSWAGQLGALLAVIFAPIGFNWQISVALVPGLAAREVAVSALGTVYALSATGDDTGAALVPLIAAGWSLPTALSLLAWYVFAPQCLSTLAVVRRETNGWRWPLVMTAYLFGLAYAASFVTYRVALAWVG
jgi:ferrous iron transport protein B